MVVLQLGPYPPPHGGVQTNLVAIREYLRSLGMSAPVINLTRHRKEEVDDVYYPRSAFEVLKLLLTLRADIIHLHIGGRLTARLLALCLFCSCLPGRRTVLTFHSGGYPSWHKRRKSGVLSWRGFVLRQLDAVIAVNTEIARLLSDLRVPASRIRIICPYVPVAVRQEVPVPENIRTFAQTHEPLLSTVGLLEPEYDLPLQIRTLPLLRKNFPDAGLVIVGSGSLEGELRELIAAQPYRDHILLCGDLPHAPTVRLISESDVFLRTTLYDGDSVSVREALQLGVPVIATDNGMRPAGVHLIERGDAVALPAAIAAALRQGPARRAEGEVAKQHLDEVLALYAEVLGTALEPRVPAINQLR